MDTITRYGRLAPDAVERAEALLRSATQADGVQPLSEQVWLQREQLEPGDHAAGWVTCPPVTGAQPWR